MRINAKLSRNPGLFRQYIEQFRAEIVLQLHGCYDRIGLRKVRFHGDRSTLFSLLDKEYLAVTGVHQDFGVSKVFLYEEDTNIV